MSTEDSKSSYVAQLQEELARERARRQALVEEFKNDLNNAEDFSPEDLKKRFKQLLAIAWERANDLIVNAESESVQWAVCKYVFQVGLGQMKITDDNDPDKAVNDLINELINPSPKETSNEQKEPNARG